MGSDGRLQYAPIPQASNAPSAPPAPSGYTPPSNLRMMAPAPQIQMLSQVPSAASNPDISSAQASLNRWSKWVKILSALILAVNITIHVAWFVDLAYPSDHSQKPCKFYIVARILAFILVTVTARAGIKASRSKTSESAKWFIKLLILTGLFLLVLIGFVSYKRMQKFRRHGGKWKGKKHGGEKGRGRKHGRKMSDNHSGIDKDLSDKGGRGLNGEHTGIDKDLSDKGGRGLNGDHSGIDKDFPQNGGRGLDDHSGIDKDIPHNGGRGLNGDHSGIDKDIPHNGGRGLNDHSGIDKDIPHNGGRLLRKVLLDEVLNGLRDLKDRDDDDNSSQGSGSDDENSQSGDNESEGSSKGKSRNGSKKSRSSKSSRSGKSDSSSNGDKDEEKGGKGEHGEKNRGKHGKKYRGCHGAVGCIAGLVVYSLLMFFAIKLYRAARNYEAIVQRGNVPIVPVMYNQPVLAYAPGMNPGNIPMGAPIQH